MTTTETPTEAPASIAGTWDIDVAHSDVSFTVRHVMVSKVRGRFSSFEGQIVTADDPMASSVSATIDLSSIDTNNEQRDDHIRSADFFDVEKHKTMTYRSTAIHRDGDNYRVEGELSLHGVTRQVPLALEVNGVAKGMQGETRSGFSATAQISRKDFGIEFNIPLDGGGVVVGDKIDISLEIEAVLRP